MTPKTINTLSLLLKTSRWNTDLIEGFFMGNRIIEGGNIPINVEQKLNKMLCPSERRLVKCQSQKDDKGQTQQP